MQEMAVLGTKKHYLHCISILHFDMYGNVTLPHALELYDWGYFDLKPVVIFPMTTPIILFELSKKGRKSAPKYRKIWEEIYVCLLYTSPSPRDRQKSRMPSSA